MEEDIQEKNDKGKKKARIKSWYKIQGREKLKI